jgi:hypothetical protein
VHSTRAAIEEAFGPFAGHLPIAFQAIDSASGSKSLTATLPGAQERSTPADTIIYSHHTIADLRGAVSGSGLTRRFDSKLAAVPLSQDGAITSGCAQQPQVGAAEYLANFPVAHESIVSSLLRTKDSKLIADCEAAGYQVITGGKIPVLGHVNLAGATATGAGVMHGMATKAIARELGYSVEYHLFAVLPSASTSVDPQAARENAGKTLLEIATAVEHPERIVLNTLDGQTFRYPDGPIFDTVTLVGVGNAFLAAGSREELAARLALLGLTYITTPFLARSAQAFADSLPAQGDRRRGLAVFRSLGIARRFYDQARNEQIAVAETAAFLGANL